MRSRCSTPLDGYVFVTDSQHTHRGMSVRRTSKDHLSLLRWAAKHGPDRIWAIEDCRNMTRRLERDLLAAGESSASHQS